MARLYSNENYPSGIVEHLRALGHDVLTTSEAGNAGRGVTDVEVLAFATEQGRVVITHSRKHFFRLHSSTKGAHAGIIACTFDPDEERQAQRVNQAIRSIEGLVLRVYRPNR